jgi:hypothetical protein
MKSTTNKLITVATVLVLGAHASASLAQPPAHTPANNARHAQNAGGGQDIQGARSPEKNQANNAYKHAMNNGKPLPNKPQKPQKPQRPQKTQ